MEAYEYATMADFETSYWWYRGLHGMIIDLLHDLNVKQDARILDAGCGTGGNLVNLGNHFTQTSGFDYSIDAAPFWARRGLRRCAVASINDMPYQDNAFDVVLSIDVFEISTVDETRGMAELWRVTRPGGLIMIVVPAYRWLYSAEHDLAVHSTRRYTRDDVIKLLKQHPIEIVRSSYLFMLLFPLIATVRLARQRFTRPTTGTPRSDLRPIPGIMNETFSFIMRIERRLLQTFSFPFGSSVLVIARKP